LWASGRLRRNFAGLGADDVGSDTAGQGQSVASGPPCRCLIGFGALAAEAGTPNRFRAFSVSPLLQVVVRDGMVVAPFNESVVEALSYDLVFLAIRAADRVDVFRESAEVAGATKGEAADPQFGVGQAELALTIGQRDLRFGHQSMTRAPVSLSSAARSLSFRLEF